ncbi:MAG: sigma-70 family RNA polymerase sigma factor [Muribaculaceae bacterium]|jgi:RNA polymerase sigma-70 factor (ECF subfamily)
MQNHTTLTDEQLVSAYAAGDNNAFDQLLKRHKARLFNFILSMVKDSDLADDIFQETFVKAIVTIRQGRYNDQGKFIAWIYRIARNLIIDSYRQDKVENQLSTDDENGVNLLNRSEFSEGTVEDTLIGMQIEEDLRALVTELPESQRQVVDMRFYQNLSFKEIAALTGVSINTALGRMRYAILNLRRMARERSVSLIK